MPTGRHTGHRAPSIADKARAARANQVANELAPIIAELQAAGVTSLNGIARSARRAAHPYAGGKWSLARGASLAAVEAARGASPVDAALLARLPRRTIAPPAPRPPTNDMVRGLCGMAAISSVNIDRRCGRPRRG
jgi:hypothetical protein